VKGSEEEVELLTPLVVDSHGRSGTTMTMALLASSPQIAMDREHPYEHRYFAWLAEWTALVDRTEWDMERWDATALSRAVDETYRGDGLVGPPPWLSRPLWEDGDLRRRLFAAAWREFSAQAIDRTRREFMTPTGRIRYHAEKTINLACLRQQSPLPIRGVVIHRDPRDIWLSVQSFDRARGFYGFGRNPGEDAEEWLERFIAMHTKRLRASLAQREHADSLLIPYEELVLRPAATTARLGSWLDLDLMADAPARDLKRNPGHSTSASAEASVGRWRRELEPHRLERFTSEMGHELRELGYED
jgi:hypothetical protein